MEDLEEPWVADGNCPLPEHWGRFGAGDWLPLRRWEHADSSHYHCVASLRIYCSKKGCEPHCAAQVCCHPTSSVGAGLQFGSYVFLSRAAEHPGEMSSRWKLGQSIKLDGGLQPVSAAYIILQLWLILS